MIHEENLQNKKGLIFESVRSGGDPLPQCVEIHPTDICNQGCSYCFHGGNGYGRERKATELLTPENYSTLFREFSTLGIPSISISGGGEPFARKDTSSIIDIAADSGISVRVVTNGNLVNSRDIYDSLLRCQEVRFSIDTINPETYAEIRNVSSYMLNITLDNIRKLIALRKITRHSLIIGVTFMVNEHNHNEFSAFASAMLDGVGVDKVVLKYDIYEDSAAQDDRNSINPETLESLKVTYGDRIEIRKRIPMLNGTPCVVPYFKVAINPYGQVYSCCLGAQPKGKNGYLLEKLDFNYVSPFQFLWQESKGVRAKMVASTRCQYCNHTDKQINQDFIA